jgi:hypothetical protein
MDSDRVSGQDPFRFVHRGDLHTIPAETVEFEVKLHGGFAVDARPGFGQIYYGMPGCGIVRIAADLRRQEIVPLPDALTPLNFHSTKLAQFDGKWRLIMPANLDQKVAILTLDGTVDLILSRPEFEAYAAAETLYRPTDTVVVGDTLFVADGYGANHILSSNLTTKRWTDIFGGKTDNPAEDGKFGTAHGIGLNPIHSRLDIADRPHGRIQVHGTDGRFIASHKLPPGSWPCGINYTRFQGRWYAVIGCLRDPVKDRPAPIYVLDAESYELLSTIRPKEELGVELAQHMHNVVFHIHRDRLYLICQAWNPGHYFVLEKA